MKRNAFRGTGPAPMPGFCQTSLPLFPLIWQSLSQPQVTVEVDLVASLDGVCHFSRGPRALHRRAESLDNTHSTSMNRNSANTNEKGAKPVCVCGGMKR